ncbi:MAG TPA: hypothetical protein PKL34_07205 [Candidatus Cloacimonadota bacterium]|nr:hypothetical protein [Candidatus Cloacimonadota bacterium]
MKRILYVLAISWLLSSPCLFAQSRGVEFYLYNSDNTRVLESLMQYQMFPMQHGVLDIHGQSSWEERLNFNQEIRRSLLGSSFGYQIGNALHSLFMDYSSHYDASDLDPTAYVNKNGNLGYRLYYNPIDSLYVNAEARALIRKEQDRYLLGNHIMSEGMQFSSGFTYHPFRDKIDARLSANMEDRSLDWEAYRLANANLSFIWSGDYLDWDNSFAISGRRDKIYNLLSNEGAKSSFYQQLDTQKRSTLDINSELSYYPGESIELRLNESYSERRTRMSENIIRNNGEFYNQLSLQMDYYPTTRLFINARAAHNMNIKDFNYAENTRHLENRSMSSMVAWEYADFDSLIVTLSIDLQKTEFPKNDHKWDNDLRTRSVRSSWKHYYRDHIRFTNNLAYEIREDVYIDSLLSAGNYVLRSLSYMPQADLLLGDRLCFSQSYQIRADYTDFGYPSENTDRLYRQLAFRYSLIFDSFPFVARAGDDKWFLMPYRTNRGSAFLADLSFSYEENQYAMEQERYYLINTKNRRYTSSLTIRHDIGEFYYSIKPQYMWGTWEEYSVVAGISWQFDNQSFLELTLTPISEERDDIDWRSSVNLSLRF